MLGKLPQVQKVKSTEEKMERIYGMPSGRIEKCRVGTQTKLINERGEILPDRGTFPREWTFGEEKNRKFKYNPVMAQAIIKKHLREVKR